MVCSSPGYVISVFILCVHAVMRCCVCWGWGWHAWIKLWISWRIHEARDGQSATGKLSLCDYSLLLIQALFLRRGQLEINELKDNISTVLWFILTSLLLLGWACCPHPFLSPVLSHLPFTIKSKTPEYFESFFYEKNIFKGRINVNVPDLPSQYGDNLARWHLFFLLWKK